MPDPDNFNSDLDALLEFADRQFHVAAERKLDYEKRNETWFGHMFKPGHVYEHAAVEKSGWIVDGLFPEGHLIILGATSKAGKTCFATALAMAIATNTPFLGKTVRPGPVLWCAYEESEAERLEVLRQWPEIPGRLYTTHEKPLIDHDDGLAALRYWVYKTDAKLIVIDPLYGATDAESLADGRVARRVLSGLKEICRKYGCIALVLHHFTKDVSVGLIRERFADSNQLLATASMDILMDSTDLPTGARLLKLSCRGRGQSSNQTLYIKSNGVTSFELVEDPKTLPTKNSLVDHRILDLLLSVPEGLTAEDMAQTLILPAAAARNHLTRLVKNNQVAASGKKGRAAIYTLR